MSGLGRWLLAASVAVVAAASPAAERVQAETQFLFKGPNQSGLAPVLVLRNPGRDLSGTLVISGYQEKTVVPLSLASGTTQKFEVTASRMDFGSSRTLETNEGRITLPMTETGGPPPSRPCLVSISDDSGAMAFMKSDTPGRNRGIGTLTWEGGASSVLEGDAKELPTRPTAYDSVDLVVVGHAGARMSDEAAQALRIALMDGRTVVLLGGAGAPWWQDPHWKDVLPAATGEALVTVDAGRIVESVKGKPTSVLNLVAKPDATEIKVDGTLLGVSQRIGRGHIVVTTFDPSADPFSTATGRREVFTNLLSDPKTSVPATTGRSRRRGRIAPPVHMGTSNDPFRIDLPKPGEVALILVAYCLVVAPLNLLLLRKLGKPELAWVTVPAVAAGAAGLLLLKSQSLYANGTASSVRAEVVLTAGQSYGIASGTTDVFYPQAGTHPVRMDGLVDVKMQGVSNPFGAQDPMTILDDGRARAAMVNTTNLSFRTFTFRQIVPANAFMDVQKVGSDLLRVTNLTHETMIGVGVNSLAGKDLKPGEWAVFKVEPGGPNDQVRPDTIRELSADLMSFEPSIGNELPDADVVHATLPISQLGVAVGTLKASKEGVNIAFIVPKRKVAE